MIEMQARNGGLGSSRRPERTRRPLQRPSDHILTSIGEGIHALDRTGRVLFENPAAEAMFGRSHGEMLGQMGHALIHHHREDGNPYPVEECPIHQTLADGVARSVEGELFFRGDGSSFRVDYLCSPMVDARGEVIGAVVTFRDSTARLLARAAQRDRESLLSNAQRMASVGSWELDVAEGRLTWSDETYRLFGLTAAQFDGTFEALHRLIVPEDRERFDVAQLRARASASGVLDVEYRIQRPDGEVRWLYDRGMAERDADGSVVRLLGMVMDVTTQKETARALRASEDRFRRMFLEAATGIALTAADGTLLDANVAYARSLGHRAEDLRGASLYGLLHAEDRVWMEERIASVLSGERASFASEIRLRSSTGSAVWHRASVSAQRDEAGGVMHLIVMAEDITEAKRAAEELERSHAMQRMATRVSHLGGYVVDVQTSTTFLSDEACAIHEIPPGSMTNVDQGLAFYAPEHRARVREAFEACARTGAPFDLELELQTARRRRIWVRAIGEAVRDPSGVIVRVEGAIQDISERKRAERALIESEQRFDQLADAMPVIVWTAEPDGKVDYANEAFTHYTGVQKVDLFGDAWHCVIHPEDLDGCTAAWAEAVEGGTPLSTEYRIRRASDGAYRWHLVRATPVLDERERITRWYGTAIEIHARKLAERQASIHAAQLTATLESITDVFFTVDPKLRLSFVNTEVERMLDRPRATLIGQPLAATFPAAFAQRLEPLFRRALQTSEPVEFEELFPPRESWLSGRAYPSAQGLAVYLRDVTEVRAAREALRASDERFQLLSRSTHDAIWDWAARTNTFWCNERLERLIGGLPRTPRSTLRRWRKRIHPDDAPRVTAALRHVLKGGEPQWAVEYRFHRPDGTEAYLLSRGNVIRDESGKAVRLLGGVTDLTERKRAEEQLASQAALLDAAHEPIMVCDLEDRIRHWNKGAERTYGWTASEVLGRKRSEVFPGSEERVKTAWRIALETGEWHGETTATARDQRVLVIDSRWTLLRDEHGQPRGVLSIHADITERKKLEQQILRAQRMESIGTLAGGIAHDLNNLLAPILVSIGLLRAGEQEAERIEDLDTLQTCAQRGADLVRQLLSFARGIEGRRVETDLAGIAAEVGWLVRDTFPKNIELRLQSRPSLWVMGDPTQLHQMMVNLCVNARDAMPKGGTLTLSMENVVLDDVYARMNPRAQAGPYVRLRVEDNGMGMPRDLVDRIFEPFFTTKEPGRGTGLGLSTTDAIVKGHGGFIDVTSEPGQGTCFDVYLPADPDVPAPTESAPQSAPELKAGEGELVLVVDDEAPIRRMVERILKAKGYRVLLAEHGAEAVGLYAQHRDQVAAVLTDMSMPVMDGAAVAVALRSLNPTVRVIATSGLEPTSALATFSGFLAKPYTADALLGSLRRVLTG